MKATLKNILFRLLALFPKNVDGRASILMYHSVGTSGDAFFSVTANEFDAQMRFLKEHDRAVIALSELVRRMKEGVPLHGEVVLTFDDGYKDNFTNAYPILKKFDFPATIFITTGLVGDVDERGFEMLSEAEIKEMHASGLIDIEPHSSSHPKLAKCSKEEVLREVRDSKDALEKLLGKTCTLFAYPYGNYSEETVHIVRELGFFAAVTVEEGTVALGDDLLRLKRNSIDRLTAWTQFCGKISRTIDRYNTIKSWR